MAEVHPLFTIFILVLSALVIYWVLVGQRKQREMFEEGYRKQMEREAKGNENKVKTRGKNKK